MHLVGRIPLKLIIGEFLFDAALPTPKTTEDLVGLSLGKVLDLTINGRFVFGLIGGFSLTTYRRFFLLLVLLFLLLFLLGVRLTTLLLLLLLVLRRLHFLLHLLLQLIALQLRLPLLFGQLHFVDPPDYIIIVLRELLQFRTSPFNLAIQ
jgi:hypothetical protein